MTEGLIRRWRRWWHRMLPTHEQIERIGWLRPLAHIILRPELWRFHRRSVPRGVAIGLLVGIFLMIPGLQIIGAVLVSLPFRANIPLAAAMTFLSNPLTTPLILVASLWIGNYLFGLHADISTLYALWGQAASIGAYADWLFSDAAPALVGGLAAIGVGSAAIGYGVSVLLWRWWIGHKWRHRRSHEDFGSDVRT